jgi:hypothetical protein
MIVPPRKSSRAASSSLPVIPQCRTRTPPTKPLKTATKASSSSAAAAAKNPPVTTQVIYKEVHILTHADILTVGLSYVGYDRKWQIRCSHERNMKRFKSFFGPDPATIAQLFKDLREQNPSFKYKEGLITLNWLFLNDKQSVLGGRWHSCEETVGPLVKKYTKMIQSLKKKKIKWSFKCNNRLKASIDCSNFITNEFRLSPSGQWFDHKSNSSGLVSLYETDEFSFSPATLTTWLCCNSINRNMKLALISSATRLYHSEDHSHRQCTT